MERLLAPQIDRPKLDAALERCCELGLWSAQDLLDAYVASGGSLETPRKAPSRATSGMTQTAAPAVQTRPLDAYKDLVDRAASRDGGKA